MHNNMSVCVLSYLEIEVSICSCSSRSTTLKEEVHAFLKLSSRSRSAAGPRDQPGAEPR